jgi:hypothetical protein
MDARLAAAVMLFAARAFMQRRERKLTGDLTTTHSVSDEYEGIKKIYPEVRGPKFAFDLAWKIIGKGIWGDFRALVDSEIAEMTRKFELDRADREAFRQVALQRESDQQSDATYGASIEMRLFEVFTQGNPLDEKRRKNLVYAIDVLIRRILVDGTGYAVAGEEKTIEVAFPLLWRLLDEQKQLYAPLVDEHGNEIASIVKADSWSAWVEEHREDFKERFRRYLARKAGRTTSLSLAEAFADLVAEARVSRLPVDFTK